MESNQKRSLFARAQRFFLSSMGCVNSSVGHQESGLVLPSTCDKHSQPSCPGKLFHDEYNLKGKLGKGAFAQVNLAHRVSDNSPVAVKITDLRGSHKEREEADPRIRRAVAREVVILRRVGAQEYCVNFFEDYAEGLLSYIVMERCDMTLLQAMEHSPELTENTLIRMIKEMLKGLLNIHQLGVVHRDIKPDNYLCTGENCTVKLCDFGLAEVLASPTSSELKGVYGTAPFMSPEMLGATGYGSGTDIWSLGVIAYVLLLGQFPYQPIETTAKAMKAAILAGVPAPTFRPRASLEASGHGRMSPEAREFLGATLDRSKASRPSALSALSLAWLTDAASKDKWSMPSLRPMLHAAKRAGAFDTRGNNPNDKGTSVDHLLQGLMESPGGNAGESLKRLSVGRRSNKTHSETSLETAAFKAGQKLDKLDPTMVQSGGAGSSHISTGTGSTLISYQSNRSKYGHRSFPTLGPEA